MAKHCENLLAEMTALLTDVRAIHPERPKRASKPRSTVALSKVFDYSVTSVLRWMGREGWTFADAQTVLTTMNAMPADNTARIQLHAGKKGERGEPAPLTKNQIKELKQTLKSAKSAAKSK